MYDFARHLSETNVKIRVECRPYVADDQHPIRLVITDSGGSVKAVLKFTPKRARDSAYPIAKILAQFMSQSDSYRLADGLRLAATRVLAARN